MYSQPLFRTVDLFGFYLPPVALWAAAALIPYLIISRLADRAGFYRLVWHRPLFDAALYVIIVGALIFGWPMLSGEISQ
ncbi:DUF1656 domain-containing protein [Ancylobacter sp. A5.8]|uniref:DUF1656 domain-containing protein n=1 Tax=Ancylobacter gelatini TaxID=2919920 RepID=UPI001F4DC878|nr:DUF1656 domain-containing protein [Ancylobacter gelatini]MCJ8144972.1 DUF1656 domain-containing protein [Ancylobacter gelatini]